MNRYKRKIKRQSEEKIKLKEEISFLEKELDKWGGNKRLIQNQDLLR